MPACTHCQFTRCPKCGHDCAKEPLLPKVFRIKADDCDRWYKGECSLGPVFTDDESEAELFSTVIECNRKMRHEDVTGCFIERVESSSQGSLDNSIVPKKSAREIAEEHGFKPPTRRINARFFDAYADAPDVDGVLAKPGSGEECES